jgi:hypothetical protein
MSDDEIIDAEDLDPAMLIEVDPDAEVLDADSIGLEGDDESFELTDDLAAEDDIIESIIADVVVEEVAEEAEIAPEAVAPVETEPVVDAIADEVSSEEEPPESSAL